MTHSGRFETRKKMSALQVGQRIWATIEEVLAEDIAIVEFEGNLLRVLNRSSSLLIPKNRVQLVVTASAPLEFRIVDPQAREERHWRNLDVEI